MNRRRLMTSGLGAVLAVATAGCGSAGAQAGDPPAGGDPSAPSDIIMIIRHAEKPTGDGPPLGLTEDGHQDPESLTVRGWQRAGALVELFAPVPDRVRPGLYRPAAVYASDPATKSKRPLQTVTPTADRLGLTIDPSYAKGHEAALAAELDTRHGVTLVAWEHETILDIASLLPGVTPEPPSTWPGDRFDLVWVLTRRGAGWRFTQVPQQLLAGDSDVPIA